MVPHAKILDNLMTRLCSSLGSTVDLRVLADSGDSLTIQVGDRTDAIVNVEVRDEQRPSFCVSYPKLNIKRNGDRHVSTATSDGVLADGVAWIVEELARHGMVTPEFSG
jgi:hypothetical protein